MHFATSIDTSNTLRPTSLQATKKKKIYHADRLHFGIHTPYTKEPVPLFILLNLANPFANEFEDTIDFSLFFLSSLCQRGKS